MTCLDSRLRGNDDCKNMILMQNIIFNNNLTIYQFSFLNMNDKQLLNEDESFIDDIENVPIKKSEKNNQVQPIDDLLKEYDRLGEND